MMRNFLLNRRFKIILLIQAFLVAAFVGCSAGNVNPIGLPGGKVMLSKKTSNDVPVVPATPQVGSGNALPNAEPLSLSIVDLNGAGRQRKSLEQLKNSIVDCLGAGSEFEPNAVLADPQILKMRSEMFVSDSSPKNPADGRVSFLISEKQTTLISGVQTTLIGQSVLGPERKFIDVAGADAGVRADGLEDELYLNSLVTIASVAAFNCDVRSTPNNLCNCSTKSDASAMLGRCLKLFDQSSEAFQKAVDSLADAENCGAPENALGFLKRRKAITSLISSYAFATAK
jgi:hypothetical protein